MRQIWKIVLPVRSNSPQEFELPTGATILHCASQARDEVSVWFEHYNSDKLDTYVFVIYGTGQNIADGDRYVGTVLDSLRVWHVYERYERRPL